MTDPLPTSVDELVRFCADRRLVLLFDASWRQNDALRWQYSDVVVTWHPTGWRVAKDRTGPLRGCFFAFGPLPVVVEDGSGELDIEEIERVREAIKRDVREVEGP